MLLLFSQTVRLGRIIAIAVSRSADQSIEVSSSAYSIGVS